MKPIIGVVPLWDDQKSSIWMLPGYMDAIREAGGVPVIFPLEICPTDLVALCQKCDGFLLTGGHDVNPALYNQDVYEKCGLPNNERDKLERVVFDYALSHDSPLFGICRGIQIINVFCGGTLYQDLPSEYDSAELVGHQMSPPYDRPCHTVCVVEGSPLSELTSAPKLNVNSYHHQAIKRLSEQLSPMAISEDGLVEAVYMPGKRFLMAVQWHPEFNFRVDETSRKLFLRFVESCK